ncbi:hypothetical protein PMAYCL1PPCAC_05057 [Pristionchus mayeri]|uniref:Uncharacterized protein n=1 Tax=Pristionchus mayeri TaxID=1317129 RepID=A0AAN5C9K0_9BILA|nr:hypothetical protein PMAYCL1PPCAC_05057 [Pristionchus mayeri]
MSSLPSLLSVLLYLLTGALLLTAVEEEEERGVAVVMDAIDAPVDTIERPLQLSTNALPDEKISKEERQARKLLRKKKKRLRELRDEIRQLGKTNEGLKAAKFVRSRDEKWKRRMLVRLDAITRRLDRLEALIVESTSRTTAKNREAEKTRKMQDRHFASISRSLNGEAGMGCSSHRDCRPGRCCHTAASSVATGAAAAATVPAATCVRHDLSETSTCSDSCQCTLQLQCYAPKDNTTQPVCKRASSTDIVSGIYLNDANAIFENS